MPVMGGCVGIGGNEICAWLVCLWDDRNGSAQSSCWLVYSPFFGVGRSSPDTPTKERDTPTVAPLRLRNPGLNNVVSVG